MSKVKSGSGAGVGAENVEVPSTTEVAALNGGAVAVRAPMGAGQFDLGDDTSSGDASKPMAGRDRQGFRLALAQERHQVAVQGRGPREEV